MTEPSRREGIPSDEQLITITGRSAEITVQIVGRLMLAIIICRLFWWQVIKRAELNQDYQDHHVRQVTYHAPRGRILDRNGVELAMNMGCVHLLIQPKRILAPVMAADVISVVTKIDRTKLLEMFATKKKSFYLETNIIGRDMDRLQAMSRVMNYSNEKDRTAAIYSSFKGMEAEQLVQIIRGKDKFTRDEAITWTAGVIVEPSTIRRYPLNSLACQLVGYTNREGVGIDGLEAKFNNTIIENGKVVRYGLQGKDGKKEAEFSRDGHIVPGTEIEIDKMVPGADYRLTIDSNIQSAAEKALAELAAKHKPKRACAIVMDPKTSEILAMANVPGYNLNERSKEIRTKADIEKTRNMAASHSFEPGSIFKPITVSCGLHTNAITEGSQFFCNGSLVLPHKVIHCTHGAKHGAVTPREIIAQSCNVCTGQIALRIGPKRLYKWIVDMGLTSKACPDLPSINKGGLANPNVKRTRWGLIANANIGFGQGVTVTPIGLLNAFSCIINGGNFIPAEILQGKKRASHRMLTEQESMIMRGFLKATVDEGTGPQAQVSGYLVGGKTGTAQRVYENPSSFQKIELPSTPLLSSQWVDELQSDLLNNLLKEFVGKGTGPLAQIAGKLVGGKPAAPKYVYVKVPGQERAKTGYESGAYVASFIGFAPVNNPDVAILVTADRPTQNGHYGGTISGPAFAKIMGETLAIRSVAADPVMKLHPQYHKRKALTD